MDVMEKKILTMQARVISVELLTQNVAMHTV